jgi:alpha-tubulin suppressor-like RCC1 family protein
VIPGANGTSCSIGNTTTADSGQYTLTAINSSGTATATVTVTVNAAVAPVILNLPTALTLSYGGSLYLGAAVGGTQPMTLQWKKDGNVLPGMNGSSLNKSGVTPSDSGQYTLTATNVTGTVVSSAVTVTVNAAVAPAVFDLPATLTLEYGYNLNLSGTYTGTAPISFQWNKDGVAIADQINAYFSKSYVTTADSGQYTVTLTNMAGSATSSAVAVVVNPAVPPAVTQQPFDQTVIVGDPVTLSVGVTGTAPFTYQWYFNDAVIPGEVSVTLGIASAQASNGGTYKVVVSNPGGTVTSNSATLTIASQLGIVAAAAGTSHTLFIRSDGGLWGLGSNTSGQINNGVFDYKHYPVFISPNVAVATAGTGYSLFVKSDGTLWAMGDNSYGQLGDGTTATRTVPVQIASSVVGVSAGSQHSLFVKADGTLWAMGNNSSGQLGDGTFVSRKSPVQVATDVTFASAGSAFSCFITSDGTLWGMGSNSTGQLGDGTSVSRSTPGQIATGVTSVSAGYSHVLFIKSDGSLWGVGYTSNGQLGDAVPGAFGTPFQVATNVTDASAGQSHSLMVKSDATVMGMGANYSGQLGDGSSIQHYTPVTIDTSGFLVRGGPNFSLYLNTNGSLLGMGDNYNGEIGGQTYAYYSPKSIAAGPLSVTTAPDGVTATDGTLVQKIRVTWTSRLGASWYEVWRGNINNSGSATRIASKVLFPLFYDVTATPGSTYYYWVKAVNPSGASAFSGADAGVAASATPPAITVQPVSQNVFAGTAVTLSVSATGLPAPTYQWRKNGVNIAGATGSTYVIGSVSASAAGTYSVVASNAYGTANSLGGILTVKTLSGSDFNNDAQGDIVWQNTVTGERFIWLMSGVSHVGGVSLGVVDAAWSIAATADFNSDGSPDLLWQNSTTGERYVWFMSGGGHMGGASLGVVPLAWSIVGATDFNGDGKPDILWQNTTTGERYIWFMNGAGHVSDASLGTVPTAWSIVAAADFNSDGEADILWQNTTTGERYIWLMNGAGHVADLSLGIVDLSWSIAAAVDFNNDGQTDILWENTSTGQRYLWLMNGVAHQSDIDLGNMSTDWKIVR